MSRERFDLVFSLGAGCSCSMMLREKELQFASFPLDWAGTPEFGAGGDIRAKTDIVVGGFVNWFKKENLERAPVYDSEKYTSYLDRGTRLYFTHDVPVGSDLEREYPALSEKFARRIDRFLRLLSGANRVLAVWVNDPRVPGEVGEEDLKYCLDAFRMAYPAAEFKIIAVNCAHGVPYESMRSFRGDGYECYAFDYRVVTEGEPTWEIRRDLFAPLLERFGCADYRTRAERRANAKREKSREWEKYKATSVLDFWLTRIKFKLYRHLERGLGRKGVLAGFRPAAGIAGPQDAKGSDGQAV